MSASGSLAGLNTVESFLSSEWSSIFSLSQLTGAEQFFQALDPSSLYPTSLGSSLIVLRDGLGRQVTINGSGFSLTAKSIQELESITTLDGALQILSTGGGTLSSIVMSLNGGQVGKLTVSSSSWTVTIGSESLNISGSLPTSIGTVATVLEQLFTGTGQLNTSFNPSTSVLKNYSVTSITLSDNGTTQASLSWSGSTLTATTGDYKLSVTGKLPTTAADVVEIAIKQSQGGGTTGFTLSSGTITQISTGQTIASLNFNGADFGSTNVLAGATGSIIDSAANISANLDALNGIGGTITVSNNNEISVSVAQLTSDAAAIGRLQNANGSAYQLAVTDNPFAISFGLPTLEQDAAHIASITSTFTGPGVTVVEFTSYQAALDKIVGGFPIYGTAKDISASLDTLGADSRITSITISDNSPITLTPSQEINDATAIQKLRNANGAPVQLDLVSAITGTVAAQTTTSEAPIKPFSTATISDPNAGANDMLTITLSGRGGALSGAGLLGSGATYTLTGADTTVTSELEGLSFTPTAGAPGTSGTTTFTLSDLSSAYPAMPIVDSATTVIDKDPAVPPTITGTVAGQTTTSEAAAKPFSKVTIGDVNASATDTLTISLTGSGGTLAGTGLTAKGSGVYTLTGTTATVTSELDALSFTPTAGGPGTSGTTTFKLSDLSSAYPTATIDSTTTVIDSDPAVAPTIAGTVAGQATASNAADSPFAKVTIGDANAGATDTLTISLTGSGGTLTGAGLLSKGSGLYTLSGAAGAVTSELDALSFISTGASGSITTFGLSDLSSAYATATVDATTTVATLAVPATVAQYLSSTSLYDAIPSGFTISDTASDISASLDALSADARIAAITISDNNAITLTAAQQVSDKAAIGKLKNANGKPVELAIGIAGTTRVLLVGGAYDIGTESDNAWTGPTLLYGGKAVTTGAFGAWAPIAAAALSGGGYEVAWKAGSGSSAQYTVWDVSASGAYVSSPFGAVAGSNPALESLEASFGQDLNGDATIGLKPTQTIGISGSVDVLLVGGDYVVGTNSGASTTDNGVPVSPWTGATLLYGGKAVMPGAFGAWAPIAAAALPGGGYEVAWKAGSGSSAQYTVWDVSASGAYVSSPFGAVAGSNPALESLEASFGQDLNGDGTIGLKPTQTIGISGSVDVLLVGGDYVVGTNNGASTTDNGVPVSPWTGATLLYGGKAVMPGAFGAWAPIAAAALSGGGYEVAWKAGSGSSAQYTVWDVSASGAYVSSPFGAVSGTDPRLEQLETTFGQDLNGDGTTGVKGLTTQTIATDNGTSLVEIAGRDYALENGGGAGPLLEYQNAAVTSGAFGAWNPIGAAALSGGGYEVAWKAGSGSSAQYTVWDVSANGAYLSSPFGAVAGSDPRLEQLETTFGQDLNGDGTTGVKGLTTQTIQTDNGTSLVEIAGRDYALETGGGAGPLLEYQNAAVTSGAFGAWNPIGAAALSGGGYEVEWEAGSGSSAQYTVWDTDANGNYVSSPIGVVSGQSFALEDLEPSFGQDLNGDGWLSTDLVTTAPSNGVVDLSGEAQPTTVNLGGDSAAASAGLNTSSLSFTGTPDDVTFGSGKSILEYALQPSSGVVEVKNFAYGTDRLNIDLLGGANSSLLAFDTTVDGNHAIALFSSSDLQHGVVLLGMPTADTAANLLASHVAFAGGHALIS